MNKVIEYMNYVLSSPTRAQLIQNDDGKLDKPTLDIINKIANEEEKEDYKLVGGRLKLEECVLKLELDNIGKPIPEMIIMDGRG